MKARDNCHTYGGGYSVSTSRRWDQSAVSFSLRGAGGDVLAFAPWSWVYEPASNDNACAKVYGYEPTTWTWPQGVSLTFTYGTGSMVRTALDADGLQVSANAGLPRRHGIR